MAGTGEASAGAPPETSSAASSERSTADRRLRRTWPQRGVLMLNVAVVLVCITGVVGLTWFRKGVEAIPRLSIQPQAGFVPDVKRGDPVNFLLVGIDDASGLAADDPARTGRGQSELTDTIMVLRVDPWHETVSVLSFPRDLFVPIPPDSRAHKINAAFAFGGIGKLIETINVNFGIPIHHFAIVDFAGFRNLVDTVGGVPLYLPWPARDEHTGFFQYDPGCVHLDGEQALAYVRSRYFEVELGDTWVQDPSSDIGRARRQQEFMRAAMQKAIDNGARNPMTMANLIGIAQQFVTLDEFVSPAQLVELGKLMQDFNPEDLETFTVPGTNAFVDDQWVYEANLAEAAPIFERFRWVPPVDGEVAADEPADAEATTTTASPSGPTVSEPESVTTSTQPAFIPETPTDVECQ